MGGDNRGSGGLRGQEQPLYLWSPPRDTALRVYKSIGCVLIVRQTEPERGYDPMNAWYDMLSICARTREREPSR